MKKTFNFRENYYLIAVLSLLIYCQKTNAQCTLVCNDNVQVSIPAYPVCSLAISPDMILEGDQPLSCPNGVLVVEMNLNSIWTPAVVYYSHIFDGAIQIRVRDLVSGNSCLGIMTVEDKLSPIMNGTTNFTIFCEDEGCGGLVPPPNVTDCDPAPVVNYTETDFVYYDCNISPFIKAWSRVYVATDDSGNFSSFSQRIRIKKRTGNAIQFPNDIEITVAGADCTPWCETVSPMAPAPSFATNPALGLPGCPKIDGVAISPVMMEGPDCLSNACTAGDNCFLTAIYNDNILPLCGGDYVIHRNWEVSGVCLPTILHTQVITVRVNDNLVCGGYTCNPPFNENSSYSTGDVTLSWSVNNTCSEQNRLKYRYFENGVWTSWSFVNVPGNTTTIVGIPPNVPFQWRVQAHCSPRLRSPFGVLNTFTTGGLAMSVNDIPLDWMDESLSEDEYEIVIPEKHLLPPAAAFGIYPNPTNGQLHIIHPNGSFSLEVELTDATGHRVLQQAFSALEQDFLMDISSLPNGLYLMKLSDENGIHYTEKVVLVKE
jgi:hypothetical protein